MISLLSGKDFHKIDFIHVTKYNKLRASYAKSTPINLDGISDIFASPNSNIVSDHDQNEKLNSSNILHDLEDESLDENTLNQDTLTTSDQNISESNNNINNNNEDNFSVLSIVQPTNDDDPHQHQQQQNDEFQPSITAEGLAYLNILRSTCDSHPLFSNQHISLMSKVLLANPNLYSELSNIKTSKGFTFDQAVIQIGVDYPWLPIGCIFGDEDCYEKFAPFYDQLIQQIHPMDPVDIHRSDLISSHVTWHGYPIFDPAVVRSCTVRGSRNLSGFALSPLCSRAERRKIESILKSASRALQRDLSGRYFPLDSTDPRLETRLLFTKPREDTMTSAAGCARDWDDDGRGIFHNDRRSLLMWVNEEDHLKLISLERGGNLISVFDRWCRAMISLETALNTGGHRFLYNTHLGYLTTCPSNIGTALRVGVSVKLPVLSTQGELFADVCDRLGLLYRPSSAKDGWCDVSNGHRVGISETETVQTVIDGVRMLIELDKCLQEELNGEGNNTFRELLEEIPEAFTPIHISTDYVELASTPRENTPIDNKLGSNYPRFKEMHTSLMAKHLTPEIYHSYVGKKTRNGYTLDECIQCGVDIPSLPVGIIACDEECYHLFRNIFHPILMQWNKLNPINNNQHHKLSCKSVLWKHSYSSSALPIELINTLEPYQEAISEVCVVFERNIGGFAMSPSLSRGDRRIILELMREFFTSQDESGMEIIRGKFLTGDELLSIGKDYFVSLSSVQTEASSSGCRRDWPDGRGVFQLYDEDLSVVINDENHIKIVSKSSNFDINKNMLAALDIINKIETFLESKHLLYQHHTNLGYLTTCPSMVGMAFKFSMKLNLNNPITKEDVLHMKHDSINVKCVKLEESLFELSNLLNLGIAEYDAIESVLSFAYDLMSLNESRMK